MFKIAVNLFPKIYVKFYMNRLCAYDRCNNCFRYLISKGITLRSNQCLLITSNDIHTSSSNFVKQFVENENKYAYSMLKNIEVYRKTLAYQHNFNELTLSDEDFRDLCSVNWYNESADNVYLGFKKLSFYSSKNPQTISDEKFNGIVKALVDKCAQLNDEDLIDILSCLRMWSPTSSVSSPNFIDLWKAVDVQCTSRMTNWDRSKLLFIADHWYLLNLTSFSDFMWRSMIRLGRKVENLTPAHLVQYLFYINARRKFPDIVPVYNIEYNLEKCYDQLSIEEIAIVAMGFFKSKKPIRSQNLVLGIMREIMNKVESIHDIALSALLKVIRYSIVPTNGDPLLALLNKLSTQIDRLSLLSCTHIALAGTSIQVFHKNTIDKIVDRFYDEIESCRLKDLERISFALSLYNYKHEKVPNIYDLLVEQICSKERSKEIERYPKCVPCCLSYLSQNAVYLQQEISKVLSKEFLVSAYGTNKHKIGREILDLDAGVELECPEYAGNRLDKKTRDYLAKIYTDKIWQYEDLLNRNLSISNNMLLQVYSSVVAILGDQKKVHLGHLIPNRERADIVYGLKDDGSAVDIPSSFRTLGIGVCKKTPDIANTKWYCIIMGTWNSYIRNTNELVGSLASKMRQLRSLNYNLIVIPWHDWRQLSLDEQQNYLHKKIYGDIKSREKLVSQ